MSEPAPRWAGATDAERVQTRIGFIVDLIRQIDPSLDVDSVRGIVLTVVHNRSLVYRIAGHLRSSPEDLTNGRSGMPGKVADLIAKLTDAGANGLVAPVCAQCGLTSVRSQRVGDGQICRCDDASQSRCARCGDIGRPTQRQGDGSGWCDLCVQVERADVLNCSACGQRRQVRGHLPEGRPMCARCLSRDAQVGTCPGCQLDTITTITATGRLCGRCRATRTAASVDARARHAARTAVIVAAIQCVATDAPTQLIQSTLDQTAAAPTTRLRLAEYLTAHPDALTSGDSTAPKALGQLIAALNLLGITSLVPPRCAGCGKTAVLGHPADAGQRICEACHHRRRVETCGVCGRQCPVAARHLDGTARCARCRKRAGAQACGECGRVKQVARRAPDGTARCSACASRDPAWWDTCSVCGARRPVNTRGADGTAVCPTCYAAPLATCDLCGRRAPVSSRRGGTITCRYCYRGRTDDCGRCGRQAVCRTSPDPAGGRWCLHCLVAYRVDELLARDDGSIDPAWDPFRSMIPQIGHPRTTLGWLRRSPAANVLHVIGHGSAPLTHATLDQATGGRHRPSGYCAR